MAGSTVSLELRSFTSSSPCTIVDGLAWLDVSDVFASIGDDNIETPGTCLGYLQLCERCPVLPQLKQSIPDQLFAKWDDDGPLFRP